MLTWSCRRFRARFTPGSAHPHRRSCPECEVYAAALESAAGLRLPLPAVLRRNLRAIAEPKPEPGAVLPFPIPRLPMPDALAARLRQIPPPARPALPDWARSPRYAVAASALLAVLLGPALNAAASRVTPALRDAEESGRRRVERLGATASEAYGAARRSVEGSLERLDARLDERLDGLSETLSDMKADMDVDVRNIINLDPRDDSAGSVRRPR
ncbi:MAG: hypothetical protein ACJ75H_00640 [Thermoanaerobaculia bacterium]